MRYWQALRRIRPAIELDRKLWGLAVAVDIEGPAPIAMVMVGPLQCALGVEPE